MDCRGIDRRGDVHEFQAEGAGGKGELADVANQGDIGVVDGDGEVGLIVEAGGLIGARGARGVFFLGGVDAMIVPDGAAEYADGEEGDGGQDYPEESGAKGG